MKANDKYYYDDATEEFFRELNYGEQNNLTRKATSRASNLSKSRNEDNFDQNLRLVHSSPRLKLNKKRRSKSASRMASSNSVINNNDNQTENIDNENSESKNEISSFFYKASNRNSNEKLIRNNSLSTMNNSNDTFNAKYIQYQRPMTFRRNKYYNNIKTQTSTKKNLEISDSISVDYYYSKVITFEVDPQSLHANFHKRTKHRKKRENNDLSLNFISKHIPISEPSFDKIERDLNSNKSVLISNNFDEETEKSWQLTLQRFRSMKSTKAVFNSIRLPEIKNYVLTKINGLTEKEQSCLIKENHLLKFQLLSQNSDNENADVIHLYAWHRLSIDPKKIVLSLTQIYHVNFCKKNSVENDDPSIQNDDFFIFETLENCICSILQYVIKWISLFPKDFVPEQSKKKKNGLSFFADDLINLIILIMKSSPEFKKISLIILAVIFFIYNGEVNPLIFSHHPCLKPKIAPKESFEFGRLIDLEIEPQILVRHFTYAELQFLRNISRNDIIDESKWNQSETLQKMFKRFNDTCSFILSTILKINKENQIDKTVFWINAMHESMKMRNYQLMFEIETAFSSQLMNEIRSKLPLAQSLKFDKMKSFLYSKSYKDDLKQRREICIPFFGNALKKVIKLFGEKKLVDIVELNECVKEVEFLFSEWGTQYVFDLDTSLLKAVNDLDGRIVSIDELKEIQS